MQYNSFKQLHAIVKLKIHLRMVKNSFEDNEKGLVMHLLVTILQKL